MGILCGVTSDQFSNLGVSLGQSIVLLAVVDNYIKYKHEQPDVRPKTTFKMPAAPEYNETDRRQDPPPPRGECDIIEGLNYGELYMCLHSLTNKLCFCASESSFYLR